MAARVVGQAVKLVVDAREQTFTLLSHRGEVRQRLRIGTDADGHIGPFLQEPDVAQGAGGRFVEPVGEVSMQIYAHASHRMQHRVARLDLPQTGWMRAPGISASSFALDSALDELAHTLGLDPLEIRLRKPCNGEPADGKPWTSKGLLDCYDLGAQMFGWKGRPKAGLAPMVACTGMAWPLPSTLDASSQGSARVGYLADGTAFVEVTAAEIGQGPARRTGHPVAEALGVARGRVTLTTAQSHLAYGAGSIGSTGTFSNAAAIHKRRRRPCAPGVHLGRPRPAFIPAWSAGRPDDDPRTVAITGPGNAGETIAALMARHPARAFTATATPGAPSGWAAAPRPRSARSSRKYRSIP